MKLFSVDQSVGKILKCVLTKFQRSTSFSLQDITVQVKIYVSCNEHVIYCYAFDFADPPFLAEDMLLT